MFLDSFFVDLFHVSIYSLHKRLSTHMSPGLTVLTYKHRLFNLLLSSASLSNFTQAIREFPRPEAAIILQLLLRPLLLCEQGQANTPSEGRQERDSKAKPERNRSALLSSAPRGENSGLLQTLRQKLSLQ